jgi:RNA 2',3'-cyclic 3'-phosphodiesterase
MKRLFAAIKVLPDEHLRAVYAEIRQLLRNEKITWVNEHNLHLTLKFFGDTPEEDIPLISNIFSEIAANYRPFELHMANTGVFGSSYNPRVVWFGIAAHPSIEALAEEILNKLDKNGYPRDRQNFRPHLTIGRVKYLENKAKFQEVIGRFKDTSLQKVKVDHFELIESKLRSRGPAYSTLHSFQLGENRG